MQNIVNYIKESFETDYEKAMHKMYIDWINLKNKKDKTPEDAANLYDLQKSLAKDKWFDRERKEREEKNKPWIITPQDTEEQRKRDAFWEPYLSIYATIDDYISKMDNKDNKLFLRTIYNSNKLKDVRTYIEGELKHSVKKNHDYRVPRQLEKPSQICIDTLNLLNTIVMSDIILKSDKLYYTIEYNFNNLTDQNSFNIVVPFGKTIDNKEGDFSNIEDEAKSTLETFIKIFKKQLGNKLNEQDLKPISNKCIVKYVKKSPFSKQYYSPNYIKTTTGEDTEMAMSSKTRDCYYLTIKKIDFTK